MASRSSGPASDQAQTLQRAIGLHQQGQLGEAERLYRQILNVRPDQFEARHLLGLIRYQQGRNREAIDLIGAALKQRPDSVVALSNYGLALEAAKRFEESLESFDRALALRPDYAEAYNNRGNVLSALGRHEDAIASYERALALRSSYPEALTNLGNEQAKLKRPEAALASYGKALAIAPDYADAHYNRGNVLSELKRHAEALGNFERAVALRPAHVEAINNRGVALSKLKRHAEALACFDQALAIKPDYAESLKNRGTALKELKRFDAALASYDRALALAPQDADAHYNRANVLKEMKRYDEAVAAYEQARSLAPEHADAFGLIDAVAAICDWDRAASIGEGLAAEIAGGNSSITPFALLSYSDDPALQWQCARNFANEVIAPSSRPRCGTVFQHQRLRVAYLAANFRRHPMAYLMARLFELHDRSRFEIFGVSYGPDDGSDIRKRLEAGFDRFFDISATSDTYAANHLRANEIDILVELQGYTQDARPGIPALRPAPIQVSYLGYPGTLGTDVIDYVIADRTVAPFEQAAFFTEKIVHLPDTYYVTDLQTPVAPVTPSRLAAGLPDAGFVFCCFNNNYKITAPIFEVWMRLLRSVDGSVLWLLRDNGAAENNLRREAQSRGIDPHRLVFAARAPMDEHLARQRLADLFLDTLPYNAHTTATDALLVGLPVLTCSGRAFAARVAASVLGAVGLPELVTHSLAEYEALALRLATEPAALAAVRDKLAAQRLTQPLFDNDRFRRHLEAAYTTMWEIGQRGEQPRSFSVAPIDS